MKLKCIFIFIYCYYRLGIYYKGSSTCLYIRDPDLIKQVFIRDYDQFFAYGMWPKYVLDMKVNNLGLLSEVRDEWSHLKATISPAFRY